MNGPWKALASLWLLCATVTAAAAEPGFYADVGLARTFQDMGDSNGIVLAIDSPLGGGVIQQYPDDIAVDDGDLGWQVTIGYRINHYIAAEIAYLRFADADVTETYILDPPPVPFFPPEITQRYTTTVAGPAVSVLGSLPLGNFDLYLRGGMFFADQQVVLKFTQGSQSMTFGEEVWFGGAGVDWSPTKDWMLRMEYQRTAKLAATLTSAATELETISFGVFFRF